MSWDLVVGSATLISIFAAYYERHNPVRAVIFGAIAVIGFLLLLVAFIGMMSA